MYVHRVLLMCIMSTGMSVLSEICCGRRWMEDSRYHSPMVSLPVGNVFVADFVRFPFEGNEIVGQISQSFYKVL